MKFYDRTEEVYEIKRHRRNINIADLDKKVQTMLAQIPALNGCSVEIRGLDLENM